MLEIGLSKIVKNYGSNNILKDVSFDIKTGERVALIGSNGCGKTTILKIIMGIENIDGGVVSIRKNSKIGFLTQVPEEISDSVTVKDVIYKNLKPILDIKERLKEYELKMNDSTDKELEKIIYSYSSLQEKFISLGGYEIDSKVGKVLNAFKIDNSMLERSFNTLSGGEKTIIQFASLMLMEPTILLLDEPTNNLDIERLEQLENYLKSYSGTIVMTSHDRYFLDKVATKTILIEREKVEIFFGNYSYFLEENERRIMLEFEKYKDQQKMIEAMKRKIKQLQEFGRLAFPNGESFFKRAASIQKRLDKIEVLEKPEEAKEIPLNFQIDNRSGKQVLNLDNFNLSVGDKELLKSSKLNVQFKDRVCIIGKNGTGKSTLIKYIMNIYKNNNNPNIKIGSNVSIGYIPQEMSFEDENLRVIDEAKKHFEGTESHLRAALFKFLFIGENVFKKLKTLSGGEKVRLKLFCLMQEKANLLILDEPTNHIDINTKEILESAIEEYKGTIIFVSHDRYFINKIAKKIVSIENKKLVNYIGNYEYYKNQVR